MAIERPDTPLAETVFPEEGPKQEGNGTYMAFKSGKVGRTYGSHGPYNSIDTTGYSKGKKKFELNTSFGGKKGVERIVDRKDVPAVISELKRGATRIEDYTGRNKKKK